GHLRHIPTVGVCRLAIPNHRLIAQSWRSGTVIDAKDQQDKITGLDLRENIGPVPLVISAARSPGVADVLDDHLFGIKKFRDECSPAGKRLTTFSFAGILRRRVTTNKNRGLAGDALRPGTSPRPQHP